MPWYVASIVANFAIAMIEYLNRTGDYSNFPSAISHTFPYIVIAQLGLFYAWRDAPSFMYAWAFFVVGNAIIRVVSAQFFVHERLSWTTLFGVSLMLIAAYFVKVGST